MIRIICYHFIRPIKKSKYPGIKGVELSSFKKQLNYFKSKYNVVGYKELINHIKGIKKLKRNSCILTFDDGYKDHVKYVLPELLKRNMTGMFFPSAHAVKNKKLLDINKLHFILGQNIEPDKIKKKLLDVLENQIFLKKIKYIDLQKLEKNFKTFHRFDSRDVNFIKYLLQIYLPRNSSTKVINILFKYFLNVRKKKLFSSLYMNKTDLKKMIKSGMYVGGHGYNHIHLKNVDKKNQLKEINENIKFLRSIGSPTNNWIMCYPHGSYNQSLINILKKKDCICALTTKSGFSDITENNYFELNRFDINDIKF